MRLRYRDTFTNTVLRMAGYQASMVVALTPTSPAVSLVFRFLIDPASEGL